MMAALVPGFGRKHEIAKVINIITSFSNTVLSPSIVLTRYSDMGTAKGFSECLPVQFSNILN